MKLRDRIRRMKYSATNKQLIGADVFGRVHAFDSVLNLLNSSPSSPFHAAATAVAVGDQYIFTRDVHFNLLKWDLHTLELLDAVSGEAVNENESYEDGEDLNWSASRFLHLANGRVYTTNAFGQLTEYDEVTLEVIRVEDIIQGGPFLDGICTDHPTVDVLGDFRGKLFFGDLETCEFPVTVEPGKGASHCVRYDKRHDRFWFSTDDGNSFGIVDTEGKAYKLYEFTNDDIEWIDFNEDFTRAYISCFDHHVYVFSNQGAEPELMNVIGPFKYQATNVIYVQDDEIYVSLQSGELIRINTAGEIIATCYEDEANSIWQMQALPNDESIVYCAMEDGSVRIVRYGSGHYGQINIEELDRLPFSFGRLYRIRPLEDGSFVAITGKGWVFRAARNGALLWRKHFHGLGKSLDVSADRKRVLFANDQGLLGELDLESGNVMQSKEFGQTIWGCAYNGAGKILVAHRDGDLKVLNHDFTEYGVITAPGMRLHKRLRLLENGNLMLCGGKEVRELDLENLKIVRNFEGATLNTVEDSVVLKDFVLCISYSSQVASYVYSEEAIVGYSREMPDFPKTVAGRVEEDGTSLLLIGGRGNYLRAYRVDDEGLTHFVRHKIL